MGNPSSQRNARSLREILIGLNNIEQHRVAAQWAKEHGRAIDLFGEFARERHLVVFQSGNECENWLDPIDNILYKMNTLTHVGGDILKLLERMDVYNSLFPITSMKLVGFQIMGETSVFPVFTQPFISFARFATKDEIQMFMSSMDFFPTGDEGKFSNGDIMLWDIHPKNVLVGDDGTMFVIDAEIDKVQKI